VFDLQLFAAEDEGRTEEPTEKKLREAREKGQVAKTTELPQAVVVIFGVMVVFFLGAWIYDAMARLMTYYLTGFTRFSLTERSVLIEFFRMTEVSGKVLLPIFAAVMVAAVLGNIVQVGFQISTHPLKFDWKKIKFDPATIIKKMFFSKQVGMNLFKSIFKVAVIGVIAYAIIVNEYELIMKTPDIGIALALKSCGIVALKIIIWTSVILLVLSIPDYIFQRHEFMESLKMTKEEMKEEIKETIGDPHMRARLRQMQMDLVMKNMIREVPKADVVVTNPTHFAVALRYDRFTMEAPMLVAKGVDSMALRIREIAKQNDVFMIENRPLAQDLYKRIDVGDMIPPDLFYAVSLIYAELYKVKGYRQAAI